MTKAQKARVAVNGYGVIGKAMDAAARSGSKAH
jgi:glyceraldehyde-3-phosphate dehydrogenase/erythrose-4-phosphate dehydrogenase